MTRSIIPLLLMLCASACSTAKRYEPVEGNIGGEGPFGVRFEVRLNSGEPLDAKPRSQIMCSITRDEFYTKSPLKVMGSVAALESVSTGLNPNITRWIIVYEEGAPASVFRCPGNVPKENWSSWTDPDYIELHKYPEWGVDTERFSSKKRLDEVPSYFQIRYRLADN